MPIKAADPNRVGSGDDLLQKYFTATLGPVIPLETVLARCCEAARTAYGVEASRFFIWEDEGRTVRVAARTDGAKTSRSAGPADGSEPVVFETSAHPILKVLRSKTTPLVYPTASPSESDPTDRPAAWIDGRLFSALIALPISTASRMLGFLTVETEQAREWTVSELRALPVIARHFAGSIETAQNFSELESDTYRLTVINEISRSLNASLNIDEIFRLLVNLTRSIVEFKFAGLLLTDERSNQLKLHMQAVYEQSWFSFGQYLSAGFALCGRALAMRQPLVVGDFQAEEKPPVRSDWMEQGYRSCVVVPLFSRGKALGVLLFLSSKADSFWVRDVEILRQVGEQAAAAIQRVQIFDDSEKRSHAAKQVARREELINRIGMAISSQLHPDMVLQHAVEALGTSLGADACFIAQCLAADVETGVNYEYRAADVPELREISIPVAGNPTVQRILASSEPVRLDAELESWTSESEIRTPGPMAAFLRGLGVHTAMYCAIYVGEKAVGFLGLHQHSQSRDWNEDDLSLVRAVTRQIAVALGNARLFSESERGRREVSSLFEMSRVLSSSTDVRELFAQVTERVAVSLGGEMCLIATYDESTNLVKARVPAYQVPEPLLDDIEFVYVPPRDETKPRNGDRPPLIGVRGGTLPLPHPDSPYLSNDAANDDRLARFLIEKWDIRNLMVSPLRIKGRAVGFVYLANHPTGFTQRDLQLLEIFAGQAAEAVVNAQLFEKTQAQAQREALLNRILTGMRESLDPDAIMENMVEQLGRALGLDRCTIDFYSPQKRIWQGIQHEYCAPGIDSLKNREQPTEKRTTFIGKMLSPLVVEDLDAEMKDFTITGRGVFEEYASRSMVLVPIFQENSVIGTIGLHHCRAPHRWDPLEIDLAVAVATQLGVAIQNARLFRRVVASQQQWQTSFDAMTDGIALLDAEGRVLQANSSLTRLCRFDSSEAIIGRGGWDLVEPRDEFPDEHPISEVLRTKVSVLAEFVDGRDRVLRESLDPIMDDQGMLMGMVMVLSDVTRERMAEQEIRQRNRELSALNAISEEITKSLEIDQIVTGAFEKTVAVMQADAALVVLLDEARDRAGNAKREDGKRLILRPVAYHGPHPENVVSALSRFKTDSGKLPLNKLDYPMVSESLAHDRPRLDRVVRDLVDRLRLGSAVVVALQSKNRILGMMVMAYHQDRTVSIHEIQLLTAVGRQVGMSVENAQLIAGLQDALSQVREVNRLKDEFLATLSHELRTPLTSVTGWSEVLLAAVARHDDPELKEGIATIHNNAENLKQLINDLLDLSRVENRILQLELEMIDINTSVALAIRTVKQSADNKGVAFEISLADGLPSVQADTNRLQQVFWNLLANAVKFTDAGGTVKIVSTQVAEGVEVSVIDNGIGIDPDFLPFVFDRFRQADGSSTRRYGGLGIGLSLVKSFTEAHGGSVTARSAGKGKGSAFFVRLPAAQPAPAATEQTTTQTVASPRTTSEMAPLPFSVLIVDDSEDNRRMLEATFKRQGYSTLTAGGADAGLRVSDRTPPDVVLVNLEIPGMDGFEFLKKFRGNPRFAGIPILGILNLSREDLRRRALESGFAGIVVKPFRRRELLETVEKLLN